MINYQDKSRITKSKYYYKYYVLAKLLEQFYTLANHIALRILFIEKVQSNS